MDGVELRWMGGINTKDGEQNNSSSDCWLYLAVGGSGQLSGG